VFISGVSLMLPAILPFMKQGGQRTAHDGFTITEVLIVLAVTSILFLSAVLLVNGKQSRTQFLTGINSMKQQLQQLANETATGYYPNASDFGCSPSGSGLTFTGPATGQGTNGGCIFLGKAVQFGLDSSSSTLGIIPLAGKQYVSGADSVTSISQTSVRALYPIGSETLTTKAFTTTLMENGLRVATSNHACGAAFPSGICYTPVTPAGPQAAGTLAFVAGDSTGAIASPAGGGNVESGSQQISLYGVSGSQVNNSPAAASAQIGGYDSGHPTHLQAASQAMICIANGATNQSGLFTIDNGLNVTLQIMAGQTCG
jgi:prepilin-type N-terminal cleavage/methylation domain-containing protein